MMKLGERTVPKWNSPTPGLPFPGKYPTRWWLRVEGVGVRWSYLGKPSVMAYQKLLKTLTALRGPVTCEMIEFDRGGRIFYFRTAVPEVENAAVFLNNGKTYGPWGEYHAWDDRRLSWVLQKHELVRVQTARGVRRAYLPIQFKNAPRWQEQYRALFARREAREEDYPPNDF